jgi:transposase
MPLIGVTVSVQRHIFIENWYLNYSSIAELSERYSISRKIAYEWINRFKQHGQLTRIFQPLI